MLLIIAILIIYPQFVFGDLMYKKCCSPNEYLLFDEKDNKYICANDANNIANKDFIFKYGNCVDFVIPPSKQVLLIKFNDIIITVGVGENFPKCCPINFSYEPAEHKCVSNDEQHNSTSDVIAFSSIGMSKCPSESHAILDHYIVGDFGPIAEWALTKNQRMYTPNEYCMDRTTIAHKQVVRTCERIEDVCTFRQCLRKCCADGMMYVDYRCQATYTHGVNRSEFDYVDDTMDDFAIIHNTTGIKLPKEDENIIKIDRRGNVQTSINDVWTNYSWAKAPYCLEYVFDEEDNTTRPFMFFIQREESHLDAWKLHISAVLLLISCVFLQITLILYLILPETQNLYGKSIVMYCCVMFLAFLTLALNKLFPDWFDNYCILNGFTIQFTFLGSFTWLNIICFDTWIAFGTMRVRNITSRRIKFKRFLFYNIYGWGAPLVICLITFVIMKYRFLPESLVPHIGVGSCFFDNAPQHYDYKIYYVFPMTTFVLINCFLFIRTISYYFTVKNDIAKIKYIVNNEKDKKCSNFNANKEKLLMFTKLFLIMGVLWLFEISLSFFRYEDNEILNYVEIVWDSINSLQGLSIFCIFILKKKVLNSVKNRLFPKQSNRHQSLDNSTTFTRITSRS